MAAGGRLGMTDVRLTGGCQCGAVRFVMTRMPKEPCICHCRMCQKHSGNFFQAFGGVDLEYFELTRGEITWWASSATAERGFCRNCGTPLAWREPGRAYIAMTTGSFDHPELVKPKHQYGAESMMPWMREIINELPPVDTGATGPQVKAPDDPHYDLIRTSNHQHPDHDTMEWTPHPCGA
jgi:hypothetical protein